MTTQIDPTAPVKASGEIEIDASADQVWETITDIARWPEWNPDVTAVSIDGPLAPGTQFRWKAGPGTIRSKLVEVDRPNVIAWTGKTLGIYAVHVWRIVEDGDRVKLHTEESWSGLPVRLLPSAMQKNLAKAIEAGLQATKAASEQAR